jgi:hypothetical protein
VTLNAVTEETADEEPDLVEGEASEVPGRGPSEVSTYYLPLATPDTHLETEAEAMSAASQRRSVASKDAPASREGGPELEA